MQDAPVVSMRADTEPGLGRVGNLRVRGEPAPAAPKMEQSNVPSLASAISRASDHKSAQVLLRLFPHTVGVAAVDLTGHIYPLHPDERPTIANAILKRHREFAAGRHCARQAMGQLGLDPVSLPSGVDRMPIWPAGLTGSISHTDDICAAVAALRGSLGDVGIDIERVGAAPANLAPDIIRRDEFLDLPNMQTGADWPTLHFCLKEAAYKAFYPGFRQIIGFHDARIRLDVVQRTFTAQMRSDPQGDGPLFEGRYAIEDGRIYAAAWAGACHGDGRHRRIAADTGQVTETAGSPAEIAGVSIEHNRSRAKASLLRLGSSVHKTDGPGTGVATGGRSMHAGDMP